MKWGLAFRLLLLHEFGHFLVALTRRCIHLCRLGINCHFTGGRLRGRSIAKVGLAIGIHPFVDAGGCRERK